MAKNEDKGWIRLHRSLLDNSFWTSETFSIGQAWVDLLLMANFADVEHYYKGNLQVIKRGQIAVSVRYLAKRWGWSKDRVARTLKTWELAKMVTANATPTGTVLTIENYAKYQNGRDANKDTYKDARKDTGKDADKDKNKKDKNEKESIKSLAPVHQAQEAQEVKEDYGNLWLTPTEYEQLEGICERVGASMTEYVDRVSDWLADNKVDPKKHVSIFKKFLRSDGYL